MTQTYLEFRILVIVICYLEFLITLVLRNRSHSIPAEPLNSDLVLGTRFSMLNQ